MRFVSASLFALLVSLVTAPYVAQAQSEWPFNREFRREVLLSEKTVLGETRQRKVEGIVAFQDGGHTVGNADDVVVADSTGKVLPSRVMFTLRKRDTWVAFDAREAEGSVWLYWGGSTAGARRAGDYDPKVSLMLRTAPMPRGANDDPRLILRAIESPRAFGMTLVDNIYHGNNPLGPDDEFVSHFSGTLNAPRSGRYRIYTNSDEASFVLIDDKPVVSWPGKHGPAYEQGGERSATVELSAGPHKVDYLHADEEGLQIMVLGWEPPDGRAEVIPPDAFVHTPVAALGPPQRKGAKPMVGFDVEQVDQLLHEEQQFTRFRFRTYVSDLPQEAAVEWTFGDGSTRLTHRKGDVEHIYVGNGPFEVTMRATDGRRELAKFEAILLPIAAMSNATIGDTVVVREYVASIVNETYSKAVPNAVFAAYWDLVQTREQSGLVLPFVEQLAERTGMRQSAWEVNDRLAHGTAIVDPKRAFELYTALVRTAPTDRDRARARTEQIELLLYKLGAPDRAMQLAASTARTKARTLEGRLAAVKVGDVHRAAGRFDEARAAYREAASDRLKDVDRKDAAVLQSAYLETVSAHITRGDLRAAREEIVKWEADFPTGKLEGDVILVIARYFQALGDHERVIDELTTLKAINPLTPHLPEVEMRLAVSHAELDHVAEARKLRDHVVAEYPNSRAARWATRLSIAGDEPPQLHSDDEDAEDGSMFVEDDPAVDDRYDYEDIFR